METNNKNICVNCGLCCDGTLFPYANINESENIDPTFAFKTFDNDGKRGFKLGCCYLKDKKCTIYDKRPYSICSSFQCEQLKLFIANKISYDEAMKIINSTILLKESIDKSLLINFPNIKAQSLYEKMSIFEKYYLEHNEPVNFRKSYSYLLLDIAKLKVITKKYFYKPKI